MGQFLNNLFSNYSIHSALVFTFCSCLFGACSHPQEVGGETILINPQNTEALSLLDFVDRVDLIQLENTPEALVSNQTTAAFVATDSGYYLLDRRSGLIRTYGIHGDFLGAIDKSGRGPGEFVGGTAMLMEETDSTLQVLTPTRGISKYSIPDAFAFSGLVSPEDSPSAFHHFFPLPDGKYLFFSASGDARLYLYDERSKAFRSYFTDIPRWLSLSFYYDFMLQSPFYKREGTVYFYTGHNGAVYRFDEQTQEIFPHYSWDFGDNTLPVNLLSQQEVSQSNPNWKQNYDNLSRKYVLSVSRICETSRFITAGAYYDENSISLVYDKKKKKGYSFRTTTENLRYYASFAHGDCCYALMSSESISAFISRDLLQNQASRDVYDSLNDDSNCIIVRYMLKR